MKALLCFPRNLSQLRHSKICKKCKKIYFQIFKTIAFDFKAGKILRIKSFQFNHFLKALPSFPRKGFQFRHSKICKQKTTSFSNAQNICFSRNAASKPFSKMLPSRIYGFKKIPKLCLAYSENAFEFVTQKLSNR